MARTKNDAATAAARAALYLKTAQEGTVLNQDLLFYSGKPTDPTNFTGNQILGTHSGGVGAALIDGIGPARQVAECDPPILVVVDVDEGDLNLVITIQSNNILPTDVFVLFNTSGNSFAPSNVQVIGDEIELTFPDPDDLPDGIYHLKVIRADNAKCFAVVNNVVTIGDVEVCPIVTTTMSSPVGEPVEPPGPPGDPFDFFPQIDIVGAGFLSGPLTITITNSGAPFNVILPDAVVVVDDNNLMFSFTGDGEEGDYIVRVALTADPSCFDEPPETIGLITF